MFICGEIVTYTKLKNKYDPYVLSVLLHYLEEQPKEKSKGKPRTFLITKDTPENAEYLKLRDEKYEATVEMMVEDAFNEIEGLAEEMREWYDNLSEGLQQTEKAERIEEAADVLEGLNRHNDFGNTDEIKLVHLPSMNVTSRAKRASEAGSCLCDAAEAIRLYVEEELDQKEDEEVSSELETLADELENAKDELEAVEFPGMYG